MRVPPAQERQLTEHGIAVLLVERPRLPALRLQPRNPRAQLAAMQIDTDGLSARIDDLVEHLEKPRETTMLRVLETKAAAGDVAISVTSAAMRICGGAAFSKHLSIERLFRDAHAGAVMAPTGDVLREFIGKSLLGMPLF